MIFLFWKPRIHYHTHGREKWLAIATKLQETERWSKREQRAWRRFHHHDYWLDKFFHAQFIRHMKRELKSWHPYDAAYHLPQLVFDMVDRCNEYWYCGYNVYAAGESTKPIKEQLEYAEKLVTKCRIAQMEEGEYPAPILAELFTFIGQHVGEWWD